MMKKTGEYIAKIQEHDGVIVESNQRTVKFQPIYKDVEKPFYCHAGDSGMDVYAYIKDDQCAKSDVHVELKGHLRAGEHKNFIVLYPGETKLVGLGFRVAIPRGLELQARPTSGNSLKKNLVVNNSPGTIDAPYRGEVGIIAHHNGSNLDYPIIIMHGDKIAQLVLCPVHECVWEDVDINGNLDETTRGEGGFGSTEK